MVKKGKGLLMAKSPHVPPVNWERKHRARGEDSITKLPDKVLCHILSFVPTKYAVRTCILSTRWKYIWASVPNLNIKERHFPYSGMESCSPVFLKFVDHVLSLRDSSDIEKFCLHCSCKGDGSDFSRIAGWIQTAIKHNVSELDLQVEANSDKSKDRTLELPQCIFMSRTLVVLKLKSNCISYTPLASGNFGSLKILHVDIPYLDNDLMEKILSCCPVLEDLTIDALLELGAVMTSKISSAELKRLRLIIPHGSSFNDHDHEYYFFVSCPKLEIFDLEQDISSNYVFENANLVKASLSLYSHGIETLQPKFSKRATSLLAGIAKVKYLSLSAHLLEVGCLPAFDNLNELKLVRHDCYNWEFLTELLNRSPNLEHLVLEYEFDEHDICLEQEDSDDEEKSLEDKEWNTPEFVPTCLLVHLKTISIRGFHGYLHEKNAVKYLLQNCAVLHKMTIYTCDFLLTKEETYKEFSVFPRGSRDCLVEFIDNSIPEEDYY